MGIIKDTYQVAKIVAIVVGMFNLNAIQETELKTYVRLQQYQWVEKRKTEQEVEEMIKTQARYISTK